MTGFEPRTSATALPTEPQPLPIIYLAFTTFVVNLSATLMITFPIRSSNVEKRLKPRSHDSNSAATSD